MHSIKTKDSNGYLRKQPSSLMKIPLFYKHWIAKACFSLVIIVSTLGMPHMAHAGFLSFIGGLLGSATQNAEAIVPVNTEDTAVKNSQTVSLLVPIINVNQNTSKDAVSINIVEDQALEAKNSPLGFGSDVSAYVISEAKIQIYKVAKGDTFASIAKKFGVSKQTILYSNELSADSSLKVGQSLVILPFDGVAYKIQKGDNISSIAKKFKADPSDIADYNNIDSKSLKVGDSIIVPGGVPESKAIAVKEKLKESVSKSTEVVEEDTKEVNDIVKNTEDLKPVVRNTPSSNGYIWPFDKDIGRISQELHDDQAYDFAAPTGTPIYAIRGGTILIARDFGYGGGYGKYVVLDMDNGGQVILAHMSKVLVESGQTVVQGQKIGLVGSTGRSTGPHLHAGFRDGTPNPYKILKKGDTGKDFN